MMQSIGSYVDGMTIRAKISIIIASCLVPFAVMVVIYINNVNKTVEFSSKEIAGASYIGALWQALVPQLATLTGSAERTRAGDAVRAAGLAHLEPFGAPDAVEALALGLRTEPTVATILGLWQRAIQKIADASNLTLDPDLDSYYLMDALTVRLPEVLAASASMRAAMPSGPVVADRSPPADYAAALRALERFEAASRAAGASFASAFAGDQHGTLQPRLGSVVAAFRGIADRVATAGAGIAARMGAGQAEGDLTAELDGALRTLTGRTDDLWMAAQGDLVRLLETRIDGMMADETRNLGILALCLMLTAIAVGMAVLSLRRPIIELARVVGRFQSGDYTAEVRHAAATNAIGDLARALQSFRLIGAQQLLTVTAINHSTAMVMITDEREHITFMSNALVELLRKLEPAFRAGRPEFSVDAMYGLHLDYYRTNPKLKRDVLVDDGRIRKVRYLVGGHILFMDMTYARNPQGEIVGHTLQWFDRTVELDAQAQVQSVVTAAVAGDFSRRIPLADKTDFIREVASGLNALSDLIERVVGGFAETMRAVAAGDLRRRDATEYGGLFAELQSSIEDTVARLSTTVTHIQRTAVEVAGAADDISGGAANLAKRAEDQASALQQTSATIEQLTASVGSNARASSETVALAHQASATAEGGGAVVQQAVDAMARIEQASRRISDISSVIEGIAFQTNLLALNAAVEAARAGEAGRGFAVVAREVRTLAQRASEAAKDITGLIKSSTAEVAQGVELVQATGAALDQIVAASQQVSTMISAISSASSEQATGIQDMSKAIAHLDSMTEQNAAVAQQSAASAAGLTGQIGELNSLVATFQTRAWAAPLPRPLALPPVADAANDGDRRRPGRRLCSA